MKNNQDTFQILRQINANSNVTQRQLAKKLNFSIGKLNYCIKALKEKGFIKLKNFKKNPRKLNYMYVLTPYGMREKINLTVNFMKRQMQEYDELKKELEEQNIKIKELKKNPKKQNVKQ